MKNHFKRAAAALTAVLLCTGMTGVLPLNAVSVSDAPTAQAQAEELKTRNSHIDLSGVHTWESEHFKFYWGDSGKDSSRVNEAFLAENAQHLEACWKVYMDSLFMNPPTESVNPALRDGNHYKVNFYLHNTGLKTTDGAEVPADWAYMGYDNQGYAFMFCCVDAMQNSPNPSWVLPHEFGHVVTAHQYGWNENKYVQSWWEAIANWYREQFLYSDYYQKWVGEPADGTDYFETYMKNLHFTPILGRDNYASWAFLQYLTENPDNLGKYGADFVRLLMQQGTRDEYPYDEIARLGGADIKETLGNYAKRLATLDFAHHDRYIARQNRMFAEQPWSWNQVFTVAEKIGDAGSVTISSDTMPENGRYTVPTERAPQQFGVNIIPLAPKDAKISVTLSGLSDAPGADWRACIVTETFDGKAKYSDLFKAGESMSVTMTKSDVKAYLVVTATPDPETWQKNGVAWAYGEGEFDENHVPFTSKTRYPYTFDLTGAAVQQKYDSGVPGHAHPNGGGFVADTATVDDSVYVAENAQVLGWANVSGNAKILGHAVVAGSAKVSGNAVIGDSAAVCGQAVVSENARVLESAMVTDAYTVSGNATVKGTAFLYGKGNAAGQAMPDGNYYDDSGRTLEKGSMYGWASSDAYVNARPYADGQTAGLEFASDLSDTYTATYAVPYGEPVWTAERTSAQGVMTFDGDDCLYVDSSYAALHDADYQTAVLLRDDQANAIFRFGNADKSILLTGINGGLQLVIKDGKETVKLNAENAYTPGKWFTVSVIFSGDTCKLVVDGRTAAEETVTLDPVDVVRDDSVYTIGGYKSIGMNGSMDFFRVNFKEVAEPEYYYTAQEEIDLTPVQDKPWYYGDMDMSNSLDIYDLVLLKKAVIAGEDYKWADCDGDGTTGVGDVVALTRRLHMRDSAGQTGQPITYRVQGSNSGSVTKG